jgi:hypothetical protein
MHAAARYLENQVERFASRPVGGMGTDPKRLFEVLAIEL